MHSPQGCTATGRTTRVYAFCSRVTDGGVTVLALNIDSQPTTFEFQATFTMFPRLEYHLTAPGGNLSSFQVELNGELLQASPSGALPAFNPVSVNTASPITLQPTSFGFFVFPDANSEACKA